MNFNKLIFFATILLSLHQKNISSGQQEKSLQHDPSIPITWHINHAHWGMVGSQTDNEGNQTFVDYHPEIDKANENLIKNLQDNKNKEKID